MAVLILKTQKDLIQRIFSDIGGMLIVTRFCIKRVILKQIPTFKKVILKK